MRQQQGFTLLELLIVVTLIAIASSVAVLSIPSSASKQLQEEALRLSSLLEIARAQSRASGLAVSLHVQARGFTFEGMPSVQKLSNHWLYETTHAPKQRVQLGPEPVIAPQQLRLLSNAGKTLVLVTDGVRPFEVQAP